jgi:hypothetical protein
MRSVWPSRPAATPSAGQLGSGLGWGSGGGVGTGGIVGAVWVRIGGTAGGQPTTCPEDGVLGVGVADGLAVSESLTPGEGERLAVSLGVGVTGVGAAVAVAQ